ncbi:MAG: hypothetical protein ACYC9N_21855, partial [Thermoanaerobaculia bacterium]
MGGGIPDETGVPPPPYDGTLAGITVWANGNPIAGSDVRRDAARRITRSDSNGLPGRTALFAYDDAGRLTGDAVATRDALESPGLAHENLYTPAEFRQERATRTALSAELWCSKMITRRIRECGLSIPLALDRSGGLRHGDERESLENSDELRASRYTLPVRWDQPARVFSAVVLKNVRAN